jgi:lysophospholipase L1-like esterase
LIINTHTNPEEDYTEFELRYYVDSVHIYFEKTDSLQTGFMLYGILPFSHEPGITFHSIGINGAATSSFMRCQRMEQQLKSIQPDLVIFGLGINDAYGRRFNPEQFELNYDSLTQRIRKANPHAAIIYATNNDSYLYRRYVNRNGVIVQKSMYKLAERNDAAVWDMFEVMGGLNSIQQWKKQGLAKYDRIHFTRPGYILLGDLFTDALMTAFGDYLCKGKVETPIIEGLSSK